MSKSKRLRQFGAARKAMFDTRDRIKFRCACGKIGYGTRRAAKLLISQRFAGDHSIGVYPCEANGSGRYYHIGHLPSSIKRGASTRSQVYGSA